MLPQTKSPDCFRNKNPEQGLFKNGLPVLNGLNTANDVRLILGKSAETYQSQVPTHIPIDGSKINSAVSGLTGKGTLNPITIRLLKRVGCLDSFEALLVKIQTLHGSIGLDAAIQALTSLPQKDQRVAPLTLEDKLQEEAKKNPELKIGFILSAFIAPRLKSYDALNPENDQYLNIDIGTDTLHNRSLSVDTRAIAEFVWSRLVKPGHAALIQEIQTMYILHKQANPDSKIDLTGLVPLNLSISTFRSLQQITQANDPLLNRLLIACPSLLNGLLGDTETTQENMIQALRANANPTLEHLLTELDPEINNLARLAFNSYKGILSAMQTHADFINRRLGRPELYYT